MIRNILTRIFPGESVPASENKPANLTAAPATQSFGIASTRDSFETSASKGSAQFDLGLVPSKEDLEGATEEQKQLLEQKKKLSDEQKKLEELKEELQKNNDNSSFDSFGNFLTGDDRGTAIEEKMQTYLNTYNEAEKSSQHISETVDETTDDVKKHIG
jgi:chromosome segregation ATPase